MVWKFKYWNFFPTKKVNFSTKFHFYFLASIFINLNFWTKIWILTHCEGGNVPMTTFFFSIFCYRRRSRKFHFIGPSIPVTTWIASAVKINFLLLFYKSLRSGTPEHTVVEKGKCHLWSKIKISTKNLTTFSQYFRFFHPIFLPTHCLKSSKMSHLNFSILALFTIFCLIKISISGNTVLPQASTFQKLAKIDHFGHF